MWPNYYLTEPHYSDMLEDGRNHVEPQQRPSQRFANKPVRGISDVGWKFFQ